MQHEFIEATGQRARFTISRQQALKQIFFDNLATLQGIAYDAYPALSPADAERIMHTLYADLSRYRGKPEGFLTWARKRIRKEAARYAFTETILSDRRCRGAIVNGIRAGLSSKTEDVAVDSEDVESEVWLLVFRMAHDLAKRSDRANIRTRLKALARIHAYGYHTCKRNRRYRLLTEGLQNGKPLLCEYLSELELASIRADEFEEIAA